VNPLELPQLKLSTAEKKLWMNCPKCLVLRESVGEKPRSLGYGSPPGHNHDANCRTFYFQCPAGTSGVIGRKIFALSQPAIGKESLTATLADPFIPRLPRVKCQTVRQAEKRRNMKLKAPEL